jgi:alpha-1,6-mannosyltransferase
VQPSSSRTLALWLSVASVLFVAVVAATPASPFQPILPAGAEPAGPFRWLAGLVGLDALQGNALAAVGVVAVSFAAVAFLLVLRETWRGAIPTGTVVWLAVAYHMVVLLLPLLFSRDVYSYAYYGKIAATYHANPYVTTPADHPGDVLARYVGPKWFDTPAVYGPLWTQLSSLVVRLVDGVSATIVAFRVLAAAASLGTLALIAWLAGRLWPERAAFAVAAFGLNPVVLFGSVGSGHNDLVVALCIAGGLALITSRHGLLATAVLTLGALVKATAGVPLLLLVVAAVARAPRGGRLRALTGHVAVAGGIALVLAAPFLQMEDPSLGMLELASHEGWLAPSRFFRRLLDATSNDTLGVVARVVLPALLVVALVAIARSLARRAAVLTPIAEGAAWGWGLLCLMLLGPVLLPWYVTWALPLVWLLPRVPRAVLIGTGTALTISQWTSEPARFARAYDVNVLFGHYVVTPIVIGLLAWLLVDLWRRVRSGAPLEDQPREVAAGAGDGRHEPPGPAAPAQG